MDMMKKDIDYLEYVYEFHKTMIKNKLILVYQGEITHQVTLAFSSLAEKAMDKQGEDSFGVKKIVYHIIVECLQNIFKYSDDAETGLPLTYGVGVFVVERTKNEYSVTTGNVIANSKVDGLKAIIDNVNNLDKQALNDLYKKTIREDNIVENSAGLGFIDIARKTRQKLIYRFEPINDKTSFFLVQMKITRDLTKL